MLILKNKVVLDDAREIVPIPDRPKDGFYVPNKLFQDPIHKHVYGTSVQAFKAIKSIMETIHSVRWSIDSVKKFMMEDLGYI